MDERAEAIWSAFPKDDAWGEEGMQSSADVMTIFSENDTYTKRWRTGALGRRVTIRLIVFDSVERAQGQLGGFVSRAESADEVAIGDAGRMLHFQNAENHQLAFVVGNLFVSCEDHVYSGAEDKPQIERRRPDEAVLAAMAKRLRELPFTLKAEPKPEEAPPADAPPAENPE